MFVLSREKKTLDDLRKWEVPELKEFLRNRGLETTGTKNELTALAIGAEHAAICTCESNRGRENTVIQKTKERKKYQSRLIVNGEQLAAVRSRNSKIIGSVKKRELKNGHLSYSCLQIQIAEFMLRAEQAPPQ